MKSTLFAREGRAFNAGIINAGTNNDHHEKGTAMTATATATGPKTAAGKAVSARNATTHGLFCRQTVLPHLGEDPAGYQKLLDTLHEQLRPRNLMERQYLELWADASWKMRRLSRLEAQAWEDDGLDEDARLTKLERLSRLQTSLRRQLDRAVRMLSQDVPNLFAHRTREDVLAKLHLTETQCAENPYRAQDVERAIQANRHWPAPADDFTDGLDNTDTRFPRPHLLTLSPPRERVGRLAAGERERGILRKRKFAKTNPPPTTPPPAWRGLPERLCLRWRGTSRRGFLSGSPLLGRGGLLSRRGFPPPPSPHAQRRQELQELEDLVNSGTLTNDECRNLLMSEDIPGFSLESGGRIKIHR